MLLKTKYRVALDRIRELEEELIKERRSNNDKHWRMLCRINDLIKEVSRLEEKVRQYGKGSNTKSNEKRTGNK